jgi:Fe-S cluster assembly protein SufD
VLCGAEALLPAAPRGVAFEAVDPLAPDAAAVLALDAPAPDAFAALNAALAPGGLVLRIGRDAALAGPLVVTHLLPAGADAAAHPRLRIELADGARATVVERFVGAAAATAAGGLCNAVTRLALGAGSALEHLHLQDQGDATTHLALLEAEVGADAMLTLRALHLGALLGRYAARVTLAGRGAAVEVHALNAIDGRRQGDLQLEVVHAAGSTRSRLVYRGLAAGRGKAAATARAVVARDAAGCDAAQSLGSLLLSPHAEADARPLLEIENDDVRCSHGATVGALDEAALFYLRSRGLGEDEARALLVFAFADDVLATLPRAPLRTHLEQRLQARLGAAAVPAAGAGA